MEGWRGLPAAAAAEVEVLLLLMMMGQRTPLKKRLREPTGWIGLGCTTCSPHTYFSGTPLAWPGLVAYHEGGEGGEVWDSMSHEEQEKELLLIY